MTYVLIYVAIGCLNSALNLWLITHVKKHKEIAEVREIMHLSPLHYWLIVFILGITWPIFVPIWLDMLFSIRVRVHVSEGDDEDDKE